MKPSKNRQRTLPFRWILIAPMFIIFVGLCVYCNSFSGPFLFDDRPNIVNNPHIRQLWPVWDAMSRPFWVNQSNAYTALQRRPVVSLTFALNYKFGGLDVWGYHAVNLAVHILTALILFGVVRRTLLLPKLAARYGRAASELSLIVSLIWMIHPIQTQSVAYIIQRCESLMGFFFLTTLYCFIRNICDAKYKKAWSALAVISCALGMASKEVMVTAPIVILMYHRVFIGDSFKTIYQKYRWFYTALAMTWVILAALVYQRIALQAGFNVWHTEGNNKPYLEYVFNQPAVILHYLKLALWPDSLCFYYGWPFVSHNVWMIFAALVVVVLLAMMTWSIRFRPKIGFLALWFFLILAPTSSIWPFNLIAAEHRMYLPLAAVVSLTVIVVYELMDYLSRRFNRAKHLISFSGLIVSTFIVTILGILTFDRNETYQSATSIWIDTAIKQPYDHELRFRLATALFQEGFKREAVEQYSIALNMNSDDNNPDTAMKHNNLAVALVSLNKLDEAFAHITQAAKLNPNSTVVKRNLEIVSVLKKNQALHSSR